MMIEIITDPAVCWLIEAALFLPAYFIAKWFV
jgi:hypothetical protein